MKNEVAIIGRGPSLVDYPANERLDADIWCLSTGYEQTCFRLRKPNLVWQLHREFLFEPVLPSLGERVMLIRPSSLLPLALVLDTDMLIKRFGLVFSSSVCWMMAKAITDGYKKISVYGYEMTHQSEYGYQRDAFYYFYGMAKALGIEVEIPKNSGVYFVEAAYELRR